MVGLDVELSRKEQNRRDVSIWFGCCRTQLFLPQTSIDRQFFILAGSDDLYCKLNEHNLFLPRYVKMRESIDVTSFSCPTKPSDTMIGQSAHPTYRKTVFQSPVSTYHSRSIAAPTEIYQRLLFPHPPKGASRYAKVFKRAR